MKQPKPYKPNDVSLTERWVNVVGSLFLIGYGVYGLWLNDLAIVLPAKRRRYFSLHLHDKAAWLMFIAMVCGAIVLISVIIDHYDQRNNESKYAIFASTMRTCAWIFFAVSLLTHIAQGR